MSTTDLIPALKPWLGSSADDQRKLAGQIDRGIIEYNMVKSDLFAKIPKGSPVVDNIIRYAEEYDFDRSITASLSSSTLTFSGYIMGHQAMSAALLRLHVQEGKILERPSDGLQVLVTDIDYDALTATVSAHGNTGALSNDTDPVSYDILGIASTDDNEDHVPLAVDFGWVECGTQIFEAMFKYGRTWENLLMAKNLGIANKVQRQVKKITTYMRNQIAYSVLRGTPVYSGGEYIHGDQTERPTMTGIFKAAKIAHETNGNEYTYVDCGGDPITEARLDSMIYHMEDDEGVDFNEGNWVIAADTVTRQYFKGFNESKIQVTRGDRQAGNYITSYISNLGKVYPIVRDAYMRKGTLAILNLDDCEWGYMQGDDIQVEELAVESRMRRKLITCQAYAKLRRRRHLGYAYNLIQNVAL